MSNRPILLVEDNPDDVELTVRAFRQNNVENEVVVAEDGEAALRVLLEEGLSPSVVLLDLKLPKLDGLEVLERMRADERTRLFPAVILTSSREEDDLVRSYRLGANSYIRKPVDFQEFIEVVRQIGMYWLLVNEVAHDEAGMT